MAEFVITYNREAQTFEPVLIRATFTQKGAEESSRLQIKEFVATPGDIVQLILDPASTPTVAVLHAKLAHDVHEEGLIARLAAVTTPVTVRVTAVPVMDPNASSSSAKPVEVTQTCTIRVDPTQRISECEELGPRLERQNERRTRLLDQLEKGSAALQRAYRSEREMAEGLQDLESQHTTALLLLGGAGTVATLALGAAAASAFAYARSVQAAVSLFGSLESAIGYGEILGGAEYGALRQLAPVVTQTIARNYAVAAVATGGATVPVGGWAAFRAKMNEGLTEAYTARDTAVRMRQALFQACTDKRKEIVELGRDIEQTRARLRGCPDVVLERLPEEFVPEVPTFERRGIQG